MPLMFSQVSISSLASVKVILKSFCKVRLGAGFNSSRGLRFGAVSHVSVAKPEGKVEDQTFKVKTKK